MSILRIFRFVSHSLPMTLGALALGACACSLAIAASQAPNGEWYVDTPFFDDFSGAVIDNTTWQVATWMEHGGQTGTSRCFVQDGILHLHFINSSTDGYLSAAIQTRQEFFYGKWEMRAKPSGVPGILNSFYTIDWNNTADPGSTSNGTKEEIDIEFLTKSFSGSSGEVHLALHASGKTSWDTRPDLALGFNPALDFHIYGFDITPEYIEWFVDDTILYRYEYADRPISITSPYQLKLNTWTAVNWIGGPPAVDVVCDYQIDWIRFTPYQPQNQSPVLDPIGNRTVPVHETLSFQVSANDPDSDPLSFSATGP